VFVLMAMILTTTKILMTKKVVQRAGLLVEKGGNSLLILMSENWGPTVVLVASQSKTLIVSDPFQEDTLSKKSFVELHSMHNLLSDF